MDIYVLHVETGREQDFCKLALASRSRPSGEVYLPMRLMPVRRKGQEVQEMRPLFPGYLFWEAESLMPGDTLAWRTIPWFYKILGNKSGPLALYGQELDMIRHFMGFGTTIGPSMVRFKIGDKLEVIHGPLKGLEGSIVRVNRRKRRVRLRLSTNGAVHEIDLGIEYFEDKPGS